MRYQFRNEIQNNSKFYANKLKSLGIKSITQYVTPRFRSLTEEERGAINTETVYWKINTKFYKLAHEYYGDSKLWWVIAFFNNMPTDSHAKLGDVIFIPLNWQAVYNAVTAQDLEV
tara:strand:+ start:124 stop:471 length:348 start_codon:yes stop_codon:yes gene_type:complete